MDSVPPALATHPVHLGPDGRVLGLPSFDGSGAWYGAYEERFADDGADARLVSWHTFTESWDGWEMHPRGAELVVVVRGAVTFVQEFDGSTVSQCLTEGQWLVNEPGVWHTADLEAGDAATCLFITSGLGTQHRPR